MKRRSFMGCCAALFVLPVKPAPPTVADRLSRFCHFPVDISTEIEIIGNDHLMSSLTFATNFAVNNHFEMGDLIPYEIPKLSADVKIVTISGDENSFYSDDVDIEWSDEILPEGRSPYFNYRDDILSLFLDKGKCVIGRIKLIAWSRR